ncbi:ribonuclease P protein component [Desulfobacterales bacterium HSG16]|nr:ribonuclease P protein component [Desulfobacterales bacterium HSG16]
MRYRLEKANRILKRSDFLRISKCGARVHNRDFLAVFYPNRLSCTRLGITVTKKVGNSVIRNRIKRLVREYFRLNRQNLPGYRDINVIAKSSAAKLGSDQAFVSLKDIFKKIDKKQAKHP